MNQGDLRSKNGNSKASSVEFADGAERSRVGVLVSLAITTKALLGVLVSVTKRSLDVASAGRSTVAGHDSNGNHGTTAKEVEDHSEHGEDGLSTEEASQQDREDGVENHGARETLDSLLPSWDGDIAISLDGEEVAVDAEYNSRAAKLERIEEGRGEPQDSTANRHGEGR